MRTPHSRFIVFLGILFSFAPAAHQGQLHQRALQSTGGAFYMTDPAGQPSDSFSTQDVTFLAGGFAPGTGCSGVGLADGAYFFQVTDPSGTTLLSRDPIERRRFNVAGGVIAGVPIGGHVVGNGPCGSKLVQTRPFLESPSSNFEYRTWVTPVSEYQAGTGVFGFHPSATKADGFKIDGRTPPVTQTKISGNAFYDLNENGVYEPQLPGEVPLAGWKVQIDSNGTVTEIVTDADGHYEFLRDMNSSPHVVTSIAPPPGFIPNPGGQWLPTTPTVRNVVTDVPFVRVDFGNLFFELNTLVARGPEFWESVDGCSLLEGCDPAWRIRLNELCLRTHLVSPPHEVEDTLFTVPLDGSSDDACALFSDYLAGHDYDDRDDNDDDGDDDDDADDDDDSDDDDDGVVDGDSDDDDECDVDDDGTAFHDDYEHEVLAFVLSRQFMAAVLNRSCGPMAGQPVYIDKENDGILVDLDVMIGITQARLCDPRSANTGPCGDQDWRAQFLECLYEWNGMNTDGTNTYTRRQNPPPIVYG